MVCVSLRPCVFETPAHLRWLHLFPLGAQQREWVLPRVPQHSAQRGVLAEVRHQPQLDLLVVGGQQHATGGEGDRVREGSSKVSGGPVRVR